MLGGDQVFVRGALRLESTDGTSRAQEEVGGDEGVCINTPFMRMAVERLGWGVSGSCCWRVSDTP